MARINPATIDQTDATTQATLSAVKQKLGMVPNMFATLAHAPAALNGYLALSDALTKGKLTAAQRELIALATAQANSCHYCLSAHTAIGKGAGLSESAILDARAARSTNPFNQAIATLADKLVRQLGVLSNDDLDAAKAAGIDQGLIMEVVANVALNILTNYTNHVADTDIDFPVVSPEL